MHFLTLIFKSVTFNICDYILNLKNFSEFESDQNINLKNI